MTLRKISMDKDFDVPALVGSVVFVMIVSAIVDYL
jgi:hypothetical protein